jgi:guanylate kinase
VLDALGRGKDVVLSLDVQGARRVRRLMGRRAVLIFLLPPSMEQLRRRLTARRTDSDAAIRLRLTAARREIACARRYDYTIVNDRLSRAVAQVRAIITSFRRNRHGHMT